MEEFNSSDELIKRMFQENGLLETSSGFTERVMRHVDARAPKAEPAYKPLISRRMWIFIASLTLGLLAGCSWILKTENQEDFWYATLLQSFSKFFSIPALQPQAYSGTLMIVTLMLATVSLLLLIDYIMNNRYQGSVKL